MRNRVVVPMWTAGTWSCWLVRLVGFAVSGSGLAAAWLRSADPSIPMTVGVPWVLAIVGVAIVAITGFDLAFEAPPAAMTRRWKLGFAIPYGTVPLDSYDEVLIRSEWKHRIGSRTPTRECYPVELRSKKRGVRRIDVVSGLDYELNRAKAVEIARTLGLRLRDRPAKLTSTATDLELFLADRQVRSANSNLPEPPADSPIELDRRHDGLRLSIPAAGHAWLSGFFVVLPVIVAGLLLVRLHGSILRVVSELPEYLVTAVIAVGSLVAAFFIGSTLVKLADVIVGTRVQVSPSAIRVTKLTGLGPRTWTLDAGKVREVEENPLGVAVRGDGRHVTIGEGLKEPVADWLRAVVTRELTGGGRGASPSSETHNVR